MPPIPDLQALQARTQGNSQICVAILDGLVDTAHPCFQGANLQRVQTLVQGDATADGRMSVHGTQIASIIFGQPGSGVEGIAPKCRGLIIPVFSDNRRQLSQLDLARAINQAIEAGAHLINISGGQLTQMGEAEHLLEQAVRSCQDNNILIVAAAGNDGCECLHVPAALPAVLAVGATDEKDKPLDISNWGKTYKTQGILAPGSQILGAKPGGGTLRSTGTSFATPIVTGVAALLLSLQLQQGEDPDPATVRQALLDNALPCDGSDEHTPRCLAGKLNISGVMTSLFSGGIMPEELQNIEPKAIDPSGCGCEGVKPETDEDEEFLSPFSSTIALSLDSAVTTAAAPSAITPSLESMESAVATAATVPSPSLSTEPTMTQVSASVTPSQPPAPPPTSIPGSDLVYALGTLGYDFGTEARRDSFKQLMPPYTIENTQIPANPYDGRQMVDYLANNISEAKSLMWTLSLELTPIYALMPVGPFAREVYEVLQQLFDGHVQAEDNDDYIERVSIPGRLTGQTTRLFSGQEVPVVAIDSSRGLYGWKVNSLVDLAVQAAQTQQAQADETAVRSSLHNFLNRVYYDLRNLGQTSQERALNFAATNAFQAAETFSEAVAGGLELDNVSVSKSPFCRMDSDCWDVILTFFNPTNILHARKTFRFTIDVSDTIPVTLGEVRSWSNR
ncbi:cyanobactin maturation protease, PatA/PatG family [Leptolyngbya sp. PCC 7375]|nr:cyanobactin maturation protease, PatA/PatG family [Leptolyngbya sp. PCC 7375]